MAHIRFGSVAAALSLVVALAACGESTSSGSAGLETQDEIASYGVGLNVGRSLQSAGDRLDMDAFRRGVEDAISEAEPALPQDSIQAAVQAFSQSIQQAEQERRAAEAEENQREGEAYLEENAARDEVNVTESGLQYEVLEEGDGPSPESGDRVRIHYTGTLLDGTEFDSSRDGDPAVFGVDQVIPGFSEGIKLMEVGSTYRFVIPGDLAYGQQGAGQQIGPNETLIFEVELLGIEEQGS